jgi:hypothetical protein
LARKKSIRRKPPKVVVPPMPILLDMGRTVTLAVKKSSAEEIIYTLSDGAKLKLKPIIISIERSKDNFNPQGEPLYQINAGFFMQTAVPKKLKRKVKSS